MLSLNAPRVTQNSCLLTTKFSTLSTTVNHKIGDKSKCCKKASTTRSIEVIQWLTDEFK